MSATPQTIPASNEKEKAAYKAGMTDKMHGYTGGLQACKKAAASGDKPCAAYLRGYYGSGAGE